MTAAKERDVAERNLIGEDMYREAGIKPNFSDIAKRYGKDRHRGVVRPGGRPRRARRQGRLLRCAHRGGCRQCAAAGSHQEGHPRVAAAQVSRRGLAGYNAFTQFMRKNGAGRPADGAAPALRDAAGAAAAVRLEGVRQDGKPRRRAVRVQRVRGDAGPFPQARVHPVGNGTTDAVDGRHDREASAACRASGSRTTCPPW